MRSLTHKAGLLILANLLKYAVGFISPMVLVRFLSQQDYGTFQQLSLVYNIATGIMVLGLPTSVYYFYHLVEKRTAGRPTLIAQTQAMLLLSGVATTAIIIFGAPAIARRMSNASLADLLPTYAFYVGLYIAGEHFLHLLISQNRYGLAVLLETGEALFRVGMIVVLLALGFGLPELVIALIVYAGLRLVLRGYMLWRGPDTLGAATWKSIFPKEQLAYAVPLAASSCVGLIGNLLDRAIVALTFTPIDYAIYSVGALEIPLDVIFQASVSNVLRASLPQLVREGNLVEIVRIWRECVRKLALIVVPSFIFLMAHAGVFITTLFTSRYEGSVAVFRIYVGLLPLHMFVLSVVPQVYGKTRLNMWVVFTAVATNVVLSFVLLRYIGYLGPAVALLCSSYLASVLYFVVTTRLLKTSFTQLVPLMPIARTALASLICLLPAAAVTALMPAGLLRLACAGLAFSVTYPVAGRLCGAFTSSDVDTARSYLRPLFPQRG